jgi:hypothetical protein
MVRCTLKILISVGVASLGQLNLQALVADAVKNQYQAIPERNVFGLRPPPAQAQPPNTPVPLPKITLTGITTILESKRALMKVAPSGSKPGAAAAELSLILTEGQREGDIEVLQIDEKAGSVKVNNSGTVMLLTFEKDGAKLPATGTPPGTFGAAPVPTALPATTNPFALPGRAAPATPGRHLRSTMPPIPGVAGASPVGGVPTPTGGVPAPAQTATPAPGQDLTPEEQAIIVELQRQAGVDNAGLLPPTPLTPTIPSAQATQNTAPVTSGPTPGQGRQPVLVPQ